MKKLLCLLLILAVPAPAKERRNSRTATVGKPKQVAFFKSSSHARSLATASPSGTGYAELGILVGLNMGYGAVNPSSSGATRNAMAASAVLNIPLGNGFSIAPELSLVQRGVQSDLYSFSTTTISGVVHLDSLELPVMLRYKFDLPGGISLFSCGGPYASVLLSRSIQVAGLVEMDLGSRFKDFDAGLMVGGGITIPFSRRSSFISMVRYTYGLTNLDGSGNQFYTRGIQTLFGAEMRF